MKMSKTSRFWSGLCAAIPALAAAWAFAGVEAGNPGGPMHGGGKIFVADRASSTVSVISVRSDEVIATLDMPSGGL